MLSQQSRDSEKFGPKATYDRYLVYNHIQE